MSQLDLLDDEEEIRERNYKQKRKKINEAARKFWAEPKNRERRKKYVNSERQKVRDLSDKEQVYHWRFLQSKLDTCKHRAKKFGMESTLTREEIKELIPDNLRCPVFHNKFIFNAFSPDNLSLDRIDNTKGYTKENTVVVSKRVNTIKGDATVEELYIIADFYHEIEKNRVDK